MCVIFPRTRLFPLAEKGAKPCCVMGLREPLIEPEDNCGLAGALVMMGERWSFMILRAAFNGLKHFEEFQSELGIARNILSNRLARLVDHGILERHILDSDRRKVEYRLTRKGGGLLPSMIALRQWGEKWVGSVSTTPVLVDSQNLKPIRPVAILSHDGRILKLSDLRWLDAEDVTSVIGSYLYDADADGHEGAVAAE